MFLTLKILPKQKEEEMASTEPEGDEKNVQKSKSSTNCIQFVSIDSNPKGIALDTFASALGDKLELMSLPVVNTYKGEIILDCDGVTNLAASMILAQNLQARLATGQDFSGGKYGMFDALHIMSKKLLSKPYEFQMKLENMKVGKLLGKGSYGKVWSADFRGSPYALKQIDPSKVRTARIYRERDMLLFLKNPRVCAIFGAWYQGHCFFLLEQCIGNLAVLNPKLTERQRFFLCIHLLEGLEFIHLKDIVHCSICPENCLVKPGIKLCIGGFGHAQILPKKAVAVNAKQNLGVFGYQEAITNKHCVYSQHSDVFSAACVIFELTTRRYFLRYRSPAVANANDYVMAFELGRRIGVKQTADLENDQFPREKLDERVNKSPLGCMLSKMITVPWTERISARMAKLQADITTIRFNYEKIIDLDNEELPVCVDEGWSFLPPPSVKPDDCKGWDTKALACLYYDADDKDARKRIRSIDEQAGDSDSEEENFFNRIPPSGVVRKDLRRDVIEDAEENLSCNNQSGLDNEHHEMMNENALGYEIDGASKSVVTINNLEDTVNTALVKAMKEVAPAMMKGIFETEMASLRQLLAKENLTEVSEKNSPTNNGDEASENASDDDDEVKDVHNTVNSNGKPEQKEAEEDELSGGNAEDGAEEDEEEDKEEDEDEEEEENEREDENDKEENESSQVKNYSSESDDGDWPASCRKIIPTQRDQDNFLKPVKSSRKHIKVSTSKSFSKKQRALDGGHVFKSVSRKRDDDANDRSFVKTKSSKHLQPSRIEEKRAKSRNENKPTFPKSADKLSMGGKSDGGKYNAQTLMDSKEKKPVPASGVKVSGLQKRPHSPPASSTSSKKARRIDGVNKVVYTHGCSYCPGKFTSKQEATDHQGVCKVRKERKKDQRK